MPVTLNKEKAASEISLEFAGQRLAELAELAQEISAKFRGGGDVDAAGRFLDVAAQAMRGVDVANLLEQIERERDENRSLMEVSLKLSSVGDIDELLKAILGSLREVVDFSAAGIFVYDAEIGQIEMEMTSGYEGSQRSRIYSKFQDGVKEGRGIVANVVFTAKPIYVPDVRLDDRYVKARDETMSELAVPIIVRGEVLGAFNLESDELDAFNSRDQRILTTFASHAGAALERARNDRLRMHTRRIEEEVSLARKIQNTFLPKSMPLFTPYDLGGMNFPSSEVGGDYFDFISITESDLGIAIGDVSGHGMAAALMMANFRACLRIEARSHYAIRTILGRVNEFLVESDTPDVFVTAFYGVLDRNNHVLTYANAGHNPPILLRSGGTHELLSSGGVLLGAFSNMSFKEARVNICPGDSLLFYTDGVTESLNEADEEFGVDRLIELARQHQALPALEMARAMCHSILQFRSQDSVQDDLTLSIVKYDTAAAH